MINIYKPIEDIKSKLLLFTLIMLLNFFAALNYKLQAQIATHFVFSTSNLGTYVPITGGHTVGGNNDDDSYYYDTIGFSFIYDGTAYTDLYIDANGYIKLGSTAPNAPYYMGPPVSLETNCIAACAYDLMGADLSTSEMRIQTIGTSPNKICVIQWRDWGIFGSSGVSSPDTTERYNFQIRLNQNNGHGYVQLVYGGFHSYSGFFSSSFAMPAQVGLSGNSSVYDFCLRTSTSGWTSTWPGTTNTDNISTYASYLPDSGRSFIWGPCTLANDSIITSSQNICQFTVPGALFGTTPTGATSFSYLWQSSTTSASSGYSAASGTDTTQDYFPSFLSNTTWFRRIVSSGACLDTTVARKIAVTNTNLWTGAVSNAWATVSNWSCFRLPLNTDSVVIDSTTFYMPVIIDGGRVTNSLTILPSASLTLNNSASDLTINGIFTLNGTISQTNGLITFARPALQTLPVATYNNITLNDNAGTTIAGNITVNGTLTLAAGKVTLNNNSITLAGTNSSVSGASTSKYINTNANGSLNIQNIGAGSRTGAVLFPVGTTTYTPVTVTNTGTSDEFRARILNGVYNLYTGNAPGGSPLAANAVNRTWVVNEVVAGGSNANITLQWNAADELTGFNRASSYVSRYAAGWNPGTAGAASGSDPYTQSLSGITSLSVFGVGSGGALPVQLIDFTGIKNAQSSNVELRWSTANEINNNYFVIERSTDGKLFYQVDEVKGNGTSNSVYVYSLTDDVSELMRQHFAIVYYRLKQVDMNGNVNDEGMVTVNISSTVLGIGMSPEPNPFSGGSLAVYINSGSDENISLTIADMTGRLITQQYAPVKKGDNTIEITNLDGLKNGLYFITMSSGNHGTITQKVVKNNQ